MPIGTITSVTGQKPWSSPQYGDFIDWQLYLDPIGDVYITQKPDSPAPQAGQQLDYFIAKQDTHGTKIKRTPQEGAPQQQSNGRGASRGSATDASIERQVAAKCAAEVLAHRDFPVSEDGVAKLTEHFAKAIKGAPAPQQQQIQPPPPTQQDAGPVDTSGFAGAPAQDDDIPF